MKLGKLGSALQPMIQPLRCLQSTEAALNMSLLCSLLHDLKDEEDEEFLKARTKLKPPSPGGTPTLAEISSSLSAIRDFMINVGASQAKKNTINRIFSLVESVDLKDVSFSEFCHVMKAALRVDVVALHLQELENNLGNEGFDAAFAALEQDRRVKTKELAAIASKFVSTTSKSAPKRQTLQRIYARHISIIDSSNKRELQRGKSAA